MVMRGGLDSQVVLVMVVVSKSLSLSLLLNTARMAVDVFGLKGVEFVVRSGGRVAVVVIGVVAFWFCGLFVVDGVVGLLEVESVFLPAV